MLPPIHRWVTAPSQLIAKLFSRDAVLTHGHDEFLSEYGIGVSKPMDGNGGGGFPKLVRRAEAEPKDEPRDRLARVEWRRIHSGSFVSLHPKGSWGSRADFLES